MKCQLENNCIDKWLCCDHCDKQYCKDKCKDKHTECKHFVPNEPKVEEQKKPKRRFWNIFRRNK